MVSAFTTTAVINYSMGAPDKAAQPVDYMPHYKQPKDDLPVASTITEDDLFDWQNRVVQLAAEMKQGYGPLLDEIRSKSNG